jgi:hypothetical protein
MSKSKEPHAIWRGIGCLMILIVPMISIALGNETIKYALKNKWAIPFELLGIPKLPNIAYKLSGLYTILYPITKVQNFYGIVVASIIYIVVISSVISLIYAVIYSVTTPSRYGPTDAPPPRVKITKKSR